MDLFGSKMNERIRELWNRSNHDEEVFAELIVKECADISDASFHNGSAGYTAILKHFGVEE